MSVKVQVMRLAHGKDLPLPSYQSEHAAGLDLLAAVPDAAPLALAAGERVLVPTGIAIALPPEYEAQVRPRSGLAARHDRRRLSWRDRGSAGESRPRASDHRARHACRSIGDRAGCTRTHSGRCIS